MRPKKEKQFTCIMENVNSSFYGAQLLIDISPGMYVYQYHTLNSIPG